MKFKFFQEKKILFLEDSWLAKIDFYLSHQFRLRVQARLLDVIFTQFASIERNLLASMLYILGAVYVALQSSDSFLLILCTLLFSVLLSDQTCKWFFKRPIRRQRPAEWFVDERKWRATWRKVRLAPEVTAIYEKYTNFSRRSYSSMCSSHAANYFAQAILMQHFMPKYAGIFYSVAALVSIGRWYIGAHFMSDIFVGVFIGTSAAAFSIYFIIPLLEQLI
jgi:membrane-associated phospholipid phosphatase